MNLIVLILNRLYFLFSKVNNSHPFSAAISFFSILVWLLIVNLKLLIYSFKPLPVNFSVFDIISLLIILFASYVYSKDKKVKISQPLVKFKVFKNILVLTIFLGTAVSFIYLANINRKKNSQNTINGNSNNKQSLEGRIRNYFKNL